MLLIVFEVAIEIPHLGSDPLQCFGVLLVEREDALEDALSVDPAQGMLEHVKLTGIVTDDNKIQGEARANASKLKPITTGQRDIHHPIRL